MVTDGNEDLESQIDQWRSYLHRRQAIHASDVEELEGHLRDQVTGLVDVGLHADEAFLIAVKRMGNLDALSREFAREHSDRLWKQLVLANGTERESSGRVRTEIGIIVVLAVVAALAIKVPMLFGWVMAPDEELDVRYFQNVSFFVLPLLRGKPWLAGLLFGLGPALVPCDWVYERPSGGRIFMHAGNDLWMYAGSPCSAARIVPQLCRWAAAGGREDHA